MASKTPAPKAHYAAKPISPLMREYVAWIKAETGYDADPMSVQLSGVLRSTFQQTKRTAKVERVRRTARARIDKATGEALRLAKTIEKESK